MSRAVTLAQVARSASVSMATASRVLNGSMGRTVRPDLAARVLAAATSLGYAVNAHAQAMARGSTTTVGLIVHDVADPYAAAIASGVMAIAAERGLLVTIASTLSDPALELRHLHALTQQRAMIVILAGSRFDDPATAVDMTRAIGTLLAGGSRVVVIGGNTLGVPTLDVGNHAGAKHLATTLFSLGYRRFAILAGPESVATSEERAAGFQDGLSDCGVRLPVENLVGAQFTRDGGYVAMTELLDNRVDIDVVFAVNDVMAVGAMAALRDRGFQIPEDVAVAGFDDIPTLRDIDPPLTTVRIPLVEMGRMAMTLALESEAAADAAVYAVHGEVVVRASTPQRRRT